VHAQEAEALELRCVIRYEASDEQAATRGEQHVMRHEHKRRALEREPY